MELVTQRLKLYEVNKEAASTFAERLGIKAEEVEFVRKGIVGPDRPGSDVFQQGALDLYSRISFDLVHVHVDRLQGRLETTL